MRAHIGRKQAQIFDQLSFHEGNIVNVAQHPLARFGWAGRAGALHQIAPKPFLQCFDAL